MGFVSRHKRVFLLSGMAVCVAAIIFTINPNLRPTFIEKALGYTVVPLQRSIASAQRFARDSFAALTDFERVFEENRALREELDRLLIDLRRLALADEENKRLSELLELAQKYAELPLSGAEIIARDPSDWYDSFNIGKGTSHGVEINMAVLGEGGGLAGVVREVYPNYSKVVSLLDDRFSVSAVSERTGDGGVVRGDVRLMQSGLCRMDYIRAEAQIMPGDEIVTTAQGSLFPPGVLIGWVTEVYPNPDGLTKYAVITPAAKLAQLETVLVVTKVYGDEDG